MAVAQIKLKEYLIEDIEDKKVFEAMYDTDCSSCFAEIYKGDPFMFMGDKKKLCMKCKEDLLMLVEERL